MDFVLNKHKVMIVALLSIVWMFLFIGVCVFAGWHLYTRHKKCLKCNPCPQACSGTSCGINLKFAPKSEEYIEILNAVQTSIDDWKTQWCKDKDEYIKKHTDEKTAVTICDAFSSATNDVTPKTIGAFNKVTCEDQPITTASRFGESIGRLSKGMC